MRSRLRVFAILVAVAAVAAAAMRLRARPQQAPLGVSMQGGDRMLAAVIDAPPPGLREAPDVLRRGIWGVDLGWERRIALALDAEAWHEWAPGASAAGGTLSFGLGARGDDASRPAPGTLVTWTDSSGRAVAPPTRHPVPSGRWQDVRLPWPTGARRVRFRSLGPEPGRSFLADPRLVRGSNSTAPPDVVLVSFDTVGRERLSLYAHPRPTSPSLAAWAGRHAVVFDDAIAAAGGTLLSHASMLSGVSPLGTGVLHGAVAAMSPKLELASQRFRAAGYRTMALVGGGFLHPDFGFARGFDRYVWTEQDAATAFPGQIAEALRLLDEPDGRPLFLFVHTYAAHEPYVAQGRIDPPPGCGTPGVRLTFDLHPDQVESPRPVFADASGRRLPTPRDPRACVEWLYDDAIAAADAAIAPFLARLARTDRARVVAITGDHGQATGGGGLYGHGWAVPAVLEVPLAFSAPGLEAGTRRADLVCGHDVAPTLLALAGLPLPARRDGRALFPQPAARRCDTIAPNPWLTLATYRSDGSVVEINPAPGAGRTPRLFDRRRDRFFARPQRLTWRDPEAQRLVSQLEALLPGRQIALANGDRDVIEVEIHSEPEGVWAALPACDCIDARQEGVYRVRLERGQSVRLGLTDRARGRLGVRIGAHRSWLELGSAPLLSDLAWDGRSTSMTSARRGSPPPSTGARVDWAGVTGPAARPVALEHLRALGYVR